MKSVQEIVCWIEGIIGHILRRPTMYGQTPEEVETVLWHYHRIWAYATNRDADLNVVEQAAHDQLTDRRSTQFSTKFRDQCPSASDDEIFAFVSENWSGIATQLGLKLQSPNGSSRALGRTETLDG